MPLKKQKEKSKRLDKADAGGQKFLKHLHELNTKLHGKHWLYTVLCCRFNATQRLRYD
ncbi:hypothetical protein FHS86_003076 [Roseimarinus sediminis]